VAYDPYNPGGEENEKKPFYKKPTSIIGVILGLFLMVSGITQMNDACEGLRGGGLREGTAIIDIITVPEAQPVPLPELPEEARFEDFIGAFPEEFYVSVSIGNMGQITFAEADSATYFRILVDGVLSEVVIKDDSTFLRQGGRGSFTEVDGGADAIERAEGYLQMMMDGMAEMMIGMQPQHTINRTTFDASEVTILGFDTVAGRDVIVYRLTDAGSSLVLYLDIETSLILKATMDGVGTILEFDAFKTSGFSFPN